MSLGDGVGTPRTKSVDGSTDLPSPRQISRDIHDERGVKLFSPNLSLQVSQR